MTNPEPLIDFRELVSIVPGEGLENLTRSLGRARGLSPSWSGRGADGGRDLLFTEILSGTLSTEKITWLVSCKDKAKSGASVGEIDLPHTGIKDKLSQHKADGFLLVTTTTASAGAKSLLDSLDKSNGGEIHTLVWDSSELTQMLLDSTNQHLLEQFLPKSYQRVKGLTSLEGAVLAFRDQVPEGVLVEIMRLVKPYSASSLKGEVVWPYDAESAEAIDKIVMRLIIERDADSAVDATEQIEYDAFVALANELTRNYYEECREYLFAIIRHHHEPDIRFNAAQLLFDHYELSKTETMEIATYLDSSALEELYSGEIVGFVVEELYINMTDYDLYQSLDELSSRTQIELVLIESLTIIANTEDRQVQFSGKMTVDAIFEFDGEEIGGYSFPGIFTGYMDEQGIYLKEASIDTYSYDNPNYTPESRTKKLL
jgi:hypothetical protein